MRIVIIGQQDFGKAVLDAFGNRGDDVTAVFCAPEQAGARPDALRVARTIADLAGAETIAAEHCAEAVQYRGLDRSWRL